MVEYNPLGKFTASDEQMILKSWSVVVGWATSVPKDSKAPWEDFVSRYPFYMEDMKGCLVASDGVMMYPGDPDQYPQIKYTFGEGQVFYFYSYGIVSFVDGGESFVTRMD